MKRSLLNSKRALVALGLLLLLCSQWPAGTPVGGERGYPANWLANAVAVLYQPLTGPLTAFSAAVRPKPAPEEGARFLPDYAYRDYLEQENAKLRKLVDDLTGLRKAHPGLAAAALDRRLASVTAAPPGRASRVLTINGGSRDGLKKGMVVVTADSCLVGRLDEPGVVDTRVRLITAPNTSLSVAIVPPTQQAPPYRVRDFARFDGKDFIAESIPGTAPVKEGDLAHLSEEGVSDPHFGGSAWPAEAEGLIVGKVVAVEQRRDDPQRKRVVIEPIHPLDRLDSVFVIVPTEDRP
jgi:cell shape-determining protein MreC